MLPRFAATLDSLQLDPDEQIPARPYIKIKAKRMTQMYYGMADRGFATGSYIMLPDEKEPGLHWQIYERWLYFPSLQINICCETQEIRKTESYERKRMSGIQGPFVAVNRSKVMNLLKEKEAT